jgi:hypothetical protein
MDLPLPVAIHPTSVVTPVPDLGPTVTNKVLQLVLILSSGSGSVLSIQIAQALLASMNFKMHW